MNKKRCFFLPFLTIVFSVTACDNAFTNESSIKRKNIRYDVFGGTVDADYESPYLDGLSYEDKQLFYFDTDPIVDIDYSNKGKTIPVHETMGQNFGCDNAVYFSLDERRGGWFLCDGSRYAVYNDQSYTNNSNRKISVYDVTTFEELYTVTLKRGVDWVSTVCSDGYIAIRLYLDMSKCSLLGLFSLSDFSYIGLVNGYDFVIYNNEIYAGTLRDDGYHAIVSNIDTGEITTFYTYADNDKLSEMQKAYISIDFHIYINKKENILFLYHRSGIDKRICYCCLNIKTKEKLYEGETTEVIYENINDYGIWLEYGFSFPNCTKMIDVKSGLIVDYYRKDVSQFVLKEDLVGYEVFNYFAIDERYVVLSIQKVVDGKVKNSQRWLYDCDNDSYIARIRGEFTNGYIIDDIYFVGFYSFYALLVYLN